MAARKIKSLIKRLWLDPVWSKVIAGLILTGITAFIVQLFGFWPVIGAVFMNAVRWTGQTTPVWNWLIVSLSMVTLAVVLNLALTVWARLTKKDSELDWRSYTEDAFYAIKWRWRYNGNGDVQDIASFCPHCDYQMYGINSHPSISVWHATYYCEHCNQFAYTFHFSDEELTDKVRRQIEMKLRNGTWADALQAESKPAVQEKQQS